MSLENNFKRVYVFDDNDKITHAVYLCMLREILIETELYVLCVGGSKALKSVITWLFYCTRNTALGLGSHAVLRIQYKQPCITNNY